MRTQSLSLVSLLTCVLLAAPAWADNVISVGTTAAQPGEVAILDVTIENDVPIVAFSFGLIHDPAVLQAVTMQYAGPVAADFVGIVTTADGLAIGVLIDYELQQVIPAGGPRLVALAIYDVEPAAVAPVGAVTPGSTGNPPIDPEFTDPTGGRITPNLVSGAVYVLGPIPSGVPTNRIRTVSNGVYRAHRPSGNLEETGVLPAGAPTDFVISTNGASWILVGSAQSVVHVGRTGTIIAEIPTGVSPTAVASLGGDGVLVAHADGTLQVIYGDGTILYGGDGVGDSPEDGALGAAVEVGVITSFASENPASYGLWAAGQERLFRLNGQGNVIVDVDMGAGNTIADIAGSSNADGAVYVLLPDRIEKRVTDGTLDHVRTLPPSTATTRIAVTAAATVDGVRHDRLAVLNSSSNEVFIYDWSEDNVVSDLPTVTHSRGGDFISWDGSGLLWIAGQDPGSGDATLTSYNSAGEVVTDLTFVGETILLTSDGGGIPAALSKGEADYDADGYTNRNELESGSNPFDGDDDPTDVVPDYVPPLESFTGEAVIVDDNHFVQLEWTWSHPTAASPDFYEITRVTDGVAGDPVPIDGTESGWLDQGVLPGTHVYQGIVIMTGGGSDCVSTTVVIGSGEVEQEVPIDVGSYSTE
ncbi:MAG: hypothetical protein VX949_01855, partial [Planctomycetota bacterium]|nr:hypothetical protein [Planctomycetota bacterium]